MRMIAGVLFLLAIGPAFGQQTTKRSEPSRAPAPANTDAWNALGSLVGTWSGEGTGDPGPGTGGFSFAWDLQEKILVRKSHADYPATKDRPAFSHQDLMIVYREPDSGLPKAVYFDNEGHVINYAVTASPDAKSIVFLSELAPPDKHDSFKTCIRAAARRQ